MRPSIGITILLDENSNLRSNPQTTPFA